MGWQAQIPLSLDVGRALGERRIWVGHGATCRALDRGGRAAKESVPVCDREDVRGDLQRRPRHEERRLILEISGTSVRADAAEQAKREGATAVTGTTTARGKQVANEVDGEV